MKTRHALICGSIALLSTASLLWAAVPLTSRPAERGSNTREASCLLKITFDPEALPLDNDAVSRLISSSGISAAGFRDLFNLFVDLHGDPPYKLTFKPLSVANRPAEPSGPTFPGPAVIAPMPGIPATPPGGMRPGSRMGGGGASAGPMAIPSEQGLARESMIFGELSVNLNEMIPPWAEEYLAEICARLRTALNDAYRSDLQYVDQQLQAAQKETAIAMRRLEDLQNMRAELAREAGRSDLARESILEESKRLETEKQKLEMDMAGQEAQRRALQMQIAELGQKVTDAAGTNTVAADLEKAVTRLQATLTQQEQGLASLEAELAAKQKAGLVSSAEAKAQVEAQRARLVETQARVLDAMSQFTQMRQSAGRAQGAERLGKLNSELANLSVTTAESEARLKLVRDQLKAFDKSLQQANIFELKVAVELPLAMQAYQTARLRQSELERRLRTALPPNVIVIGGK